MVCALAVAGAAVANASPASASTQTPSVTAAQSAATGPTAGTEDAVTTIDSETSTVDEATASAGSLCRTGWAKLSYKDVFGIVLFWYKMTTYWCYNGAIVTTHSTSENAGVTATGSATGWSYLGVIERSFHCYVASGSTRSCSGNFEDSQGSFQACIAKIGCYASKQPYIYEKENYKGEFFWGT
jgi:hypothetical protein